MVEQADDAPLLFWAEGPAVSAPGPGEAGGWKGSPWGGGGEREPGAAAAAGSGGRLQEPDSEQVEEDQIVAVFVVTFDPRTGKSAAGALLPLPSDGGPLSPAARPAPYANRFLCRAGKRHSSPRGLISATVHSGQLGAERVL